MKHQSARRSSLFLMELILAILFFSLASAVCIRLFAKAHTAGNDTQNLNMAVTQAQSAAEILSGGDTDFTILMSLFPQSQSDGSRLTIYYDSSWQAADSSSCTYLMEITAGQNEDPVTYQIRVLTSDNTELYRLSTAYHTPVTIKQAE